ncbi:nucleotidyltransferase domain-containing protein [Rhodovibrio sodomensis]|nr:nucleotidyltransferase domain-containing protein [Rhodovibrio sodomensis]
MPTRTVNHTLGRLAEAGVLKTAGTSNVRLYTLASAHPLTQAIRGVFVSEAARFRGLVQGISEVAETQTPYVTAIWLYGSVARKEDRFDSDLDIVVVVDASKTAAVRENVLDELERVGDRFAVSISPIVLTRADIKRVVADEDPWWQNLRNEAQTLYGRRPTAFEVEIASQASTVRR